jgi:hypothetical protein
VTTRLGIKLRMNRTESIPTDQEGGACCIDQPSRGTERENTSFSYSSGTTLLTFKFINLVPNSTCARVLDCIYVCAIALS